MVTAPSPRFSAESLFGALRWLAALALLFGLLLLIARLGIERLWFAQFGAEMVVMRRWLLQLLGFAVVMGLGVPLQLQQLNRCWRLRQQAASKDLPQSP